MFDADLLAASGVDSDCPALLRALRLHHATQTGPLPYATQLAIVATLQSLEAAAMPKAGNTEPDSKPDTSKLKKK